MALYGSFPAWKAKLSTRGSKMRNEIGRRFFRLGTAIEFHRRGMAEGREHSGEGGILEQ